jgi:ATP-dependent RNA helicase DDX3X
MERDERLEKELFGQVVTQGIDFDKYQDIPMEMSGNDYPEAMTSFEESKIHEVLLDNIKLCGYKSPTPIQKGSLAVCMKGRDLMGCAQTGSGKTAAFILPMAHVLLTTELKVPDQRNSNSYRRPKPCPFALILGPTRELVMQIYAESRKFMYRTGLRNVCVYGGAPSGQQIRELERGVDVVVATPGRLIDMITRGKLTLEVLKFLVLDEADRMLDMGFEPQIRDILEYCPQAGDRQTMMFSATFPNEIQALAQDFLSDYIFLSVGKVGDTANNVTQAFVYAPEREKNRELFKVLESVDGLTLIFVETKRTADYIERILCEEGIEATSIHGGGAEHVPLRTLPCDGGH